jgi:hypothetical protein
VANVSEQSITTSVPITIAWALRSSIRTGYGSIATSGLSTPSFRAAFSAFMRPTSGE